MKIRRTLIDEWWQPAFSFASKTSFRWNDGNQKDHLFRTNISRIRWIYWKYYWSGIALVYFHPKYNSSGLGDWACTLQIPNCKNSCSSSFRCFFLWILLSNNALQLWIKSLNWFKNIINLLKHPSTYLHWSGNKNLESKP